MDTLAGLRAAFVLFEATRETDEAIVFLLFWMITNTYGPYGHLWGGGVANCQTIGLSAATATCWG